MTHFSFDARTLNARTEGKKVVSLGDAFQSGDVSLEFRDFDFSVLQLFVEFLEDFGKVCSRHYCLLF